MLTPNLSPSPMLLQTRGCGCARPETSWGYTQRFAALLDGASPPLRKLRTALAQRGTPGELQAIALRADPRNLPGDHPPYPHQCPSPDTGLFVIGWGLWGTGTAGSAGSGGETGLGSFFPVVFVLLITLFHVSADKTQVPFPPHI